MTGARPQAILVVDDDETILSSVECILLDEGYSVSVAANGREALERAADDPPCLVLLDMRMPVMDGWAFAAACRRLPGPHAPVVVMTAAHDSRSRATEIGADAYIAKPFDVDSLIAVVHRYAGQRDV